MAEDNWWAKDSYATAAAAKGSAQPTGRAKTTPQDMQMLRDSTARAEAERNARRDYASTKRAVLDMGTGPAKARYLDAITPEQDGGIMDTIGGLLGTPLRWFVSDKTMGARDQLKTLGAQTALKGSQMMKGSSSDKDTALMRSAGVSDYKGVRENLRILREADRTSAIEQHRATLKAKWIGRYGSLSAPAPNGMTYEDAATRQERIVNQAMDIRERGIPKPPPKTKRAPAPSRTVIDMNGNTLR